MDVLSSPHITMYDEWIYQTDSFQTPPQPQPAPVVLAPSSPHLDRPKTRKRGKSLLQSVAIDGNVWTENTFAPKQKMSLPWKILTSIGIQKSFSQA